MRIAIAQINPTVGDIDGNARKIVWYAKKAKRLGAAIVVFPELSLCGYPPEDLLLKPSFVEQNLKKIQLVSRSIKEIVAIVGFPDRDKGSLYNAAALIEGGRIKGVYHKMHLPNYGVFDEKRYFKEGAGPFMFTLGNASCGIDICEDAWHIDGPLRKQAQKGANIIFVVNASPYHAGKMKEREEALRKQARQNKVFIVYANMVGGQDELVFDGQSFAMDKKGNITHRAKAFEEDLLLIETDKKSKAPEPLGELEEIYQALLLGLNDYVRKNNFKKVIIGLSGGIDSSLTAAIAVEALGKENTVGVFMPSMFTSAVSKADATELARRLGIKMLTIPIDNIYQTYLRDLKAVFKDLAPNTAEENLQARIRGNLLMALSNKFNYLVIATGNKSEISCGYCTLYGDMAGGFSVIKDVPKTLVYKLARHVVNKKKEIIPQRVLTRPPTAELRSNQKDTDTLPPYHVLDPIIEAYVEKDKSLQDIIRKGAKMGAALGVIRMIDANEYKRRQASPGIKITPKAFGRDRRMPITHRFSEKG